MELRGDRVVLRPLAEGDVDRIVALGADPEVARWWRGLTTEHVRAKARGGDEGAAVFAIVAGKVVGSARTAPGATACSSTCSRATSTLRAKPSNSLLLGALQQLE